MVSLAFILTQVIDYAHHQTQIISRQVTNYSEIVICNDKQPRETKKMPWFCGYGFDFSDYSVVSSLLKIIIIIL